MYCFISRRFAVPASIVAVALALGCSDRASTVTDPIAATAPSQVIVQFPIRPNPNLYVEISAGVTFTCARRNSGAVFCWGTGALSGPRPKAILFQPNLDTLRAASISAGAAFACAVNTTSDGICWGDGDQGQLGSNLGYGPEDPTIVFGGHKFFAIGAGTMVTCGVATDGAFCWGRHPDWSNPISNDVASPVQLSTFNQYHDVTVGTEHACATIIGSNGREVDCWGIDSVGQLGIDPAIFPNFAPFTVRSTFATPVRRVVAKDSVTCAELTSGAVQCAGVNSNGQLGNGTTGAPNFTPQTVIGGHVFHDVSVGETHVCALDDSNHAFCWGKNSFGELGSGDINPRTSPTAVVGGLTFTAIGAGYQHTCAIGTDNNLYCWGANYYGQQGQNSKNNIAWTTPGQVYLPQ